MSETEEAAYVVAQEYIKHINMPDAAISAKQRLQHYDNDVITLMLSAIDAYIDLSAPY